MWHLRRVHMESVGHADARFDPLTVSLTDSEGEPASSVLWLENMGGKTSWLSLVFSTLRPSLTEFLGKPDKQLGDYVLATDTAHVILEFAQVSGARTLTGSGTRLLLGQVLQWRQHRQEKTRESAQLNRQLWAVVVPSNHASLTFESAVELIRTPGSQRRPLPDFTSQLADLMAGDVFRPDSNQSRWAEWLQHHGLDPDVFADQLKMSADEGSISERFHFQTGDELVQWAMPYIIPPEVPEGIASVVDQVRDTLAQRPTLVAQQEFCAAVEGRLAYAGIQQRQLDDQRAEASAVWDSSLVVVDQFRTAVGAAEGVGRRHRDEAEKYEQQAKDALSLRNQRQQQQRQAQLVVAQLHHAEALAAHRGASEELTSFAQGAEAWETTGSLLRLGEVQSRLEQVDALVAEVNDLAAPLRAAVSTAESRLASKLSHLRIAEQDLLEKAEEQLRKAREDDDEAMAALSQAQADKNAATAEAATAEAKLGQLAAELSQAAAEGLLAPGQTIQDALAAVSADVERRHAEVDRLTRVASVAQKDVLAVRIELSSAQAAEGRARAAFEKAAARAAAVTSAAERLLDVPAVATAFHVSHPDLWHDGPAAASRLADEADAAGSERVAIELNAATDRRAVDWLDRTGLLPPSPDVERILAVLAEAGVRGAYSGWDVLRTQVPVDRHVDVITRHPDVVNGVVLTDPAQLAVAIDSTRDLQLTAPTVIALAEALHDGTEASVVVLPGPAALHDERAVPEESLRRQAQIDQADGAREVLGVQERTARDARAALLNFLDANPASEVTRWRSEVATCATELESAERAGQATADNLEVAEAGERVARLAVQPAQLALAERERAHKDLQKLQVSQAGVAEETRLLAEAQRSLAGCDERIRVATNARENAARRISAGETQKSDVRVRLSSIEMMFSRHHLIASDHPAPAEPLDTLESALELARVELLAAAPPDQLAKEQSALQKERSDLFALLRKRDGTIVELARALLASPEGATADARHTAGRAAKNALADAHGKEALARDALEKAEADLRDKSGIPPSRRAPLDDEPTTAGEARALVERLGVEAAAFLTEQNEAADREAHHTQSAHESDSSALALRREADDLVELLRRHASMMRRPSEILDERRDAVPWSGSAAQAEQERRARQVQLDEAAEYMRIATDERNHALDDVRHLAAAHCDLLAADLPTLLPRLTEGNPDQRGANAQDLATQLRAYAMTIENQLADVERHRRIVIDHLTGKVKETVKLLERMQRRTRLPAGLEGWSDRSFLHLTHPKLPETTGELAGRVGTVVDRICAEPSKTATSAWTSSTQRCRPPLEGPSRPPSSSRTRG